MKLQCCFCKHICSNFEYDEMLDCELALEEEGKEKCCMSKDKPFNSFELETNENTCIRYLNHWQQDFKAFNSVQKHEEIDFREMLENITNREENEYGND